MEQTETTLLQRTLFSLLGSFVCFWFVYATGLQLGFEGIWLVTSALFSAFVILTFALVYYVGMVQKQLGALHDGIKSFKDADFSVRIYPDGDAHCSPILNVYNELAKNLTEQRQALSQKEHLLDSIIQASPMAIIVFNPFKQVVYHNQ